MPQYVEGSGDMSMRGKIEYTIRKEDDIGKKKTCRVWLQNEYKKIKVDEVELGDFEGEKESY